MFQPLFSEKLAVLKEISKPSFDIIINQDQLFITQGPKVFVYSMSDYKLKHSFGRRGEGPGEFKLGPDEEVYLVPFGDQLVIESSGRISFFSREGRLIKETKIPFRSTYTLLQPLGKQFIGFKDEMDEKTKVYYKLLCIFNEHLKKQKEVCRVKHVFQQKGLTLLRGTFLFKAADNRVFVTYWGGDFIMDCFDQNGQKLFTLKDEKFRKRKVSTKDIDRIHSYFKTYHEAWFARNRNHLHIREYWPAIGTFFLDSDRIYIVTYIPQQEGVKDKWLVYIYDQQGKFIKKLFLPLIERDIWSTYPHTFYQNRLYQLLENEETEEWELHVTPIN
jgi:hypothetical protein